MMGFVNSNLNGDWFEKSARMVWISVLLVIISGRFVRCMISEIMVDLTVYSSCTACGIEERILE